MGLNLTSFQPVDNLVREIYFHPNPFPALFLAYRERGSTPPKRVKHKVAAFR
jgi:hypothetical protein